MFIARRIDLCSRSRNSSCFCKQLRIPDVYKRQELLRHVAEIPELKTERLTLSAITEADIPAYNVLVLDGDRNRWWGYDDVGGLGAPVTERSFYDVAEHDFEKRLAVNFAVRLDGNLIGEAVLYNFDYRGGAELGCRIDKAYAGNGYGTEAFRACLLYTSPEGSRHRCPGSGRRFRTDRTCGHLRTAGGTPAGALYHLLAHH